MRTAQFDTNTPLRYLITGPAIKSLWAGALLALIAWPSWSAPPNPTASDIRGNTAGGSFALINIPPDAWFNTAFGFNTLPDDPALLLKMHSDSNTAFGSIALLDHARYESGDGNTGVGFGTLDSANAYNTAVGYKTLQIGERFNTASGAYALNWNRGRNNTATGVRALAYNSSGSHSANGSSNTALGMLALDANDSGSSNTATGSYALLQNNSGAFNTADGNDALGSNSKGSANTATGSSALAANTEGTSNTASGYYALGSNRNGSGNTATGTGSLSDNSSGSFNTATGWGALSANTTASFNTATGISALSKNTIGTSNTASGYFALSANIGGGANTATGSGALLNNVGGNANTAHGSDALLANRSGSSNTALGFSALSKNLDGHQNTALGQQALANKSIGHRNLALGFQAGSTLIAGSNNLYLASPGIAAESNTIRIGNTANHKKTFIAGIRGVTTELSTAVQVMIDTNGRLGIALSSKRYKEDIRDMGEASRGLLQLRPVTYRYKQAADDGATPSEYGLIAEEVAKVYPDLVSYGTDGRIETVQYHKLTTLLLNELQCLYRQHAEAHAQNNTMAALLATEQAKNRRQEALAQAQIEQLARIKQQVAAMQRENHNLETLLARWQPRENKPAGPLAANNN